MNNNIRRMFAGVAALGIALSGMALGSVAMADEAPEAAHEACASAAASTTPTCGTITIFDQKTYAIDHKFGGIRLGYITDASAKATKQDSEGNQHYGLHNFSVNTTPAYRTLIENAMKYVWRSTEGTTQNLYTLYSKDKNYFAGENSNKNNPMGWIVQNVTGQEGQGEPWGHVTTHTSNGETNESNAYDTEVRQLADQLANQAVAAKTAYEKTLSSGNWGTTADGKEYAEDGIGTVNQVEPGMWLLIDNTSPQGLQTGANAETGSGAILVSSTYANVPLVNDEDQYTSNGTDSVESASQAKAVTATTLGGNNLGRVEVKNTQPNVAKEVVRKKSDGSDYETQTNPSYSIGDTVTYRLYSRIPLYTGYGSNNQYTGAKGCQTTDATKYVCNQQNPWQAASNNMGARQLRIIDTASTTLTVDTGVTNGASNAVESVYLVPKDKTVADKSAAVKLVEGKDYDVSFNLGITALYGKETKDGKQVSSDTAASDQQDHHTIYNGGTETVVDLGRYVNMAAGSTSRQANKVLENYNVQVIFKATLNKNANVSTPQDVKANPNWVKLQYSNDVRDVSKSDTLDGGEVNVYSFKFQLKKTDKGGSTVLGGAKFKVKGPEGWLKDTENGEWAFTDNESEAKEFESASDGDDKGYVKGLDGLKEGEYTVKETKAPEGYLSAGLPTFKVTIAPRYTQDPNAYAQAQGFETWNGTSIVWGDYLIGDWNWNSETNKWNSPDSGWVGQKSESNLYTEKDGSKTYKLSITTTGADQASIDANALYQVNVWNAKNVTELPLTGGLGLYLIIGGGLLLMVLAGVFVVRSLKANAERNNVSVA